MVESVSAPLDVRSVSEMDLGRCLRSLMSRGPCSSDCGTYGGRLASEDDLDGCSRCTMVGEACADGDMSAAAAGLLGTGEVG